MGRVLGLGSLLAPSQQCISTFWHLHAHLGLESQAVSQWLFAECQLGSHILQGMVGTKCFNLIDASTAATVAAALNLVPGPFQVRVAVHLLGMHVQCINVLLQFASASFLDFTV
jgi:hypothetical protein